MTNEGIQMPSIAFGVQVPPEHMDEAKKMLDGLITHQHDDHHARQKKRGYSRIKIFHQKFPIEQFIIYAEASNLAAAMAAPDDGEGFGSEFNKRFEALKLWGFAFSRLVREFDGLLVWTWTARDDLARAGALEEDLSGLVEQVARSKGMRIALLFSEATGSLKISCRTSASAPSVDAAALMAGFGGGGHVRAAGALVPSSSVAQDGTALREEVLAAARQALDRARRPA